MPQISIYEKDLTALAANELVDNIVYIPGYAVKGPVNKPTLITNINKFEEIFGTIPYTFRKAQSWPTGYSTNQFALAGALEKSAIYATELVNQGLPVMFERVMKEDIIEDWTARLVLPHISGTAEEPIINEEFILKAKNPGLFYTRMGVTLAELGNDYILDIFIDGIKVEKIRFNFSPEDTDYFLNKQSNFIVFPEFSEDLPVELSVQSTEIKFIMDVGTDTTEDEFKVTDFYDLLTGKTNTPTILEKLLDKDEFDLSFLTTGSYPVYGLTQEVTVTLDEEGSAKYFYTKPTNLSELLVAIAGTRGDVEAILDYNNYDTTGKLQLALDVHADLKTDEGLQKILIGRADKVETALKYGQMLAPWGTYSTVVLKKNINLPASFGYLISYAKSIKNNPNHYAIAGVTRGLIPTLLQLNENITGAKAQALQEGNIQINPITFVNPYGFCIWGNKTLHENKEELVASSFLNVRVLSNSVKKIIYRSSKKLSFENDSEVLWLTFKAEVEPELDKMIAGNGLTKYRLLRKTSTKRATMKSVVRLSVIEPVEDFDIDIEITDSYVSIQ